MEDIGRRGREERKRGVTCKQRGRKSGRLERETEEKKIGKKQTNKPGERFGGKTYLHKYPFQIHPVEKPTSELHYKGTVMYPKDFNRS